ncbi:MAG: hypothetical protein K2J85_02205, partial [Anaeroplasmataceae bacterium]|nr:hypothetical protein [Anaeroplasmataceae bacterium]
MSQNEEIKAWHDATLFFCVIKASIGRRELVIRLFFRYPYDIMIVQNIGIYRREYYEKDLQAHRPGLRQLRRQNGN